MRIFKYCLVVLMFISLGSPIQAIDVEITDSEFMHNAITSSPTSNILDSIGSPIQSDPSSLSYIIDSECNVANETSIIPTNAVLDASSFPVQSDPSSLSYIIDSEYSITDATAIIPTNAVLDASGSPAQSNPSGLSYIIDREYSIADATAIIPTNAVLDASDSPVQSDPSSLSYLVETEFSFADVVSVIPTTTVLDPSGSPIQSNPSSLSYIIDSEFTVLGDSELIPLYSSFYTYPSTAYQGQDTELSVIVDLTEITMNVGDPVQWYITTPGGKTITGESDTLKCCLAGGLYDKAYYDFPEYGTYTIRVEFPGYIEYAQWNVKTYHSYALSTSISDTFSIDEPVILTTSVTNTGSTTANITLEVTSTGGYSSTRTLTVPVGSTSTESFDFGTYNAGTYSATINMYDGTILLESDTKSFMVFYYEQSDIHSLFSTPLQIEVGGTFYRWYKTIPGSSISIDSNYLEYSQPDKNGIFSVSIKTSELGITAPGTLDIVTNSVSQKTVN